MNLNKYSLLDSIKVTLSCFLYIFFDICVNVPSLNANASQKHFPFIKGFVFIVSSFRMNMITHYNYDFLSVFRNMYFNHEGNKYLTSTFQRNIKDVCTYIDHRRLSKFIYTGCFRKPLVYHFMEHLVYFFKLQEQNSSR